MSHQAEPVMITALTDCTHEMSDKTSEASDDWLVSGLSSMEQCLGICQRSLNWWTFVLLGNFAASDCQCTFHWSVSLQRILFTDCAELFAVDQGIWEG